MRFLNVNRRESLHQSCRAFHDSLRLAPKLHFHQQFSPLAKLGDCEQVSHALALHRGIASVRRGPTTLLTRETHGGLASVIRTVEAF